MPKTEPLLALVHHQFGPYHIARAQELCRTFAGTVYLIQLATSESLRVWHAGASDLVIETAYDGVLEAAPPTAVATGVRRILDRLQPRVVAIAGYAHEGMRAAAKWARHRGARSILMSDSQRRDVPRHRWREWLKKTWVSRNFDAAFVAGAGAANYVEQLGIPPDRIWRGYDVVDNEYFRSQARAARTEAAHWRHTLDLPQHYLLYVGRFATEKNLHRLLQAFSAVSQQPLLRGWGLVLAGSGPLEAELRRQALPLGDRVRFVGFQQIERLPPYYALASALVLPSLSEPWGLVVNEAMACNLPPIVSSQCGSAMDLVFPGTNGWIVDPLDTGSIAAALREAAADAVRRQAYGDASARIVEAFSLQTWARSLIDCARTLA